jgi:DNA replication protein DnaD
MPIPPELNNLIQRLSSELNELERNATSGANLARQILARFPNNDRLTQLFASLNNTLFFAQLRRRQIEELTQLIQPASVPPDVINEAAQELGTILGQVLEAKMNTSRILTILENLR